jgi:hypothetical protein
MSAEWVVWGFSVILDGLEVGLRFLSPGFSFTKVRTFSYCSDFILCEGEVEMRGFQFFGVDTHHYPPRGGNQKGNAKNASTGSAAPFCGWAKNSSTSVGWRQKVPTALG